MSHVMTTAIEDGQGLVTRLECDEPEDAPCRHRSGDCDLVEAFYWDVAASLEGYHGPTFDVSKFVIEVTEITDEGEFSWQLAGHEPADADAGAGR